MKPSYEQTRAKLAAAVARLFGKPYLPGGLVGVAVMCIVLDAVMILISQPALYWLDNTQAASRFGFLRTVMTVHPLALVGATALYLLIFWALLSLLTRSIALWVWLPLSYVHLNHIMVAAVEKVNLITPANQAVFDLWIQVAAGTFLGLALVMILLRPRAQARTAATAVWKHSPAWLAVVLVVVALSSGGILWAAGIPRDGWKPITPAHSPGKRMSAGLAYDPVGQKAYLFGGTSEFLGTDWLMHDDLWVWDGRDWQRVEFGAGPSGRMEHAMAFDEKRGVVVLFGGKDKNGLQTDTWEFDGQAWELKRSESGLVPEPRVEHQLFFDPNRETMILSGGYGDKGEDGKDRFYNDVWEWDGRDWTPMVSGNDQPTLTYYSVAVDPLEGRVVAFNYNGPFVWSDQSWARLAIPGEPPERFHSVMAAYPHGGLLLFGGTKDEVDYNDTWFLKSQTWQELKPALSPFGRINAVMFYDRVRSAFVLYGGRHQDNLLDDMWEYAPQ